MPVVPYPPQMPLFEKKIRHSRALEDRWLAPITFRELLVLTTILFLASLAGFTYVTEHGALIQGLSKQAHLIIIALLPALIILLTAIFAPRASMPIFPYQVAMFQTEEDREIRWNLAVVATAHVYCGHIAQSEWLSQTPSLNPEERFRALGYIRRVYNRLQRIPAIDWRDMTATIAVGLLAISVSALLFHFPWLEASLHGLALTLFLEMFILYFYVMRWQHIRRLIELEEIFEELLPPAPLPKESTSPEDEVEQWYREKAELERKKNELPKKAKSDPVDEYPPAPWE